MALTSIEDIKSTPVRTPDQDAPGEARLSLDPATERRRGINGGWWPRSRDAGAELPALITGLSTQAGRVSRVALQADAFGNIPHLLTVGGRKVRVAWFRHMNTHTVSLTMGGRDYLTLLVIPPHASPASAAEALRLAASSGPVGSPEAILAAAGIAADGDPDEPRPAENAAR
jgi:uncharacterized protein DUF5994